MNMTTRAVFLAVVLIMPGVPAWAEVHEISLGPAGNLTLEAPDDWSMEEQGSEGEGGPALVFSPPENVPLLLLVTPLPVPDPDGNALEAARERTQSAAGSAREVSVEQELPLIELEGPHCRGFYFSATDRTVDEPSMEDFKYVEQGAVVTGPVMVTFTVLTNLQDDPQRRAAIEVIRSSRWGPPEMPVQDEHGTVRLPYPGKDWALLIDLPGFDLEPLMRGSEGRSIQLAGSNVVREVTLTLFLEPAESGWSAVEYRDHLIERLSKYPPEERKVRRWERDDVAFLQYRIAVINQTHRNAEMVRDGVWVDVHLSKLDFRAKDRELFDRILGSVRFEEE